MGHVPMPMYHNMAAAGGINVPNGHHLNPPNYHGGDPRHGYPAMPPGLQQPMISQPQQAPRIPPSDPPPPPPPAAYLLPNPNTNAGNGPGLGANVTLSIPEHGMHTNEPIRSTQQFIATQANKHALSPGTGAAAGRALLSLALGKDGKVPGNGAHSLPPAANGDGGVHTQGDSAQGARDAAGDSRQQDSARRAGGRRRQGKQLPPLSPRVDSGLLPPDAPKAQTKQSLMVCDE